MCITAMSIAKVGSMPDPAIAPRAGIVTATIALIGAGNARMARVMDMVIDK